MLNLPKLMILYLIVTNVLVQAQVSVFSRLGLLMREIRFNTGYTLDDIIKHSQESWNYITEATDVPTETIDNTVPSESICDLQLNPAGHTWVDFIRDGIHLKFKDKTRFDEVMSTRSKWLVVVAMGRFDQGKTLFISNERWANRSLTSGYTTPTHGICYLLPQNPENKHTIWVDTEGLYRGPTELAGELSSSVSERETDLKRATGSAQLDYLIKQGNVLVWFVGALDDHAIMNFQNLLNRIEMWDPDNKKKLIVVHNLITHLYDIEVMYASKSIRIWETQQQYSPKEDVTYYVTYHDDVGVKKDVIHVFLAREGSPAGKERNNKTMEFVANLVNTFPAQTQISVEEIRKAWAEIIPDYLVPKTPGDSCDVSYFKENTEWFSLRRIQSLWLNTINVVSEYMTYNNRRSKCLSEDGKCYSDFVQVKQRADDGSKFDLQLTLDFEADVVPVDEYGQPSWLDQNVRIYPDLPDTFIISVDLPGSEVVIFTNANIDELTAEKLAEYVKEKFVVFPYGDNIVIQGTRLPPEYGCGGVPDDFGFMQKRIKIPKQVPNKEDFQFTLERGTLELSFKKRKLNLF